MLLETVLAVGGGVGSVVILVVVVAMCCTVSIKHTHLHVSGTCFTAHLISLLSSL